MPRRQNAIPTYRLHKQSGQAIVTIRGPGGQRRDLVLGKYGSPESRAEYQRVLTELDASPAGAIPVTARVGLTISEAMLAFARHANQHYRNPRGKVTRELSEFRQAIRLIRELYGHTSAREFGPLALKAVRQKMIEADLCRGVINSRVARVRRIFKWLASEELVPATVFQSLATVSGLQKGKCEARESEPVRPVSALTVRLTLPWLTPAVAGLVRLMTFTGMRPGEACGIRPCDVDTSGEVWIYSPPAHKNAWRGKPRQVAIGKRGQEVLREFQPADPNDFYFSPKRSVDAFHAARTVARKTPRYQGRMRRNAAKRKASHSRPPAEQYTALSVGHAIEKAAKRANRFREQHLADCGPNLPEIEPWAPNRIRHSHATEVRSGSASRRPTWPPPKAVFVDDARHIAGFELAHRRAHLHPAVIARGGRLPRSHDRNENTVRFIRR